MVFLFFFGFLDGLAMLSPTVFGLYGFFWFSRCLCSPSISEKQTRAQIRVQGHICSVSNRWFFFVFFGFLDGLAMLSPTVLGFYGFVGFLHVSNKKNHFGAPTGFPMFLVVWIICA